MASAASGSLSVVSATRAEVALVAGRTGTSAASAGCVHTSSANVIAMIPRKRAGYTRKLAIASSAQSNPHATTQFYK